MWAGGRGVAGAGAWWGRMSGKRIPPMNALALCCSSSIIPLTGEATTGRIGQVTARGQPPAPKLGFFHGTPPLTHGLGAVAKYSTLTPKHMGSVPCDLLVVPRAVEGGQTGTGTEKQPPEAGRLGGDGVSLVTRAPDLPGQTKSLPLADMKLGHLPADGQCAVSLSCPSPAPL